MKKVWTEEELKNVKKHILFRNNLEIKDGALVKGKNFDMSIVSRNFSIINSNTSDTFCKSIENILFNTNKEDIQEVLNKVEGIKQMVESDPTNQYYRGLLSNISKIDPEDQSEIFVIFKEIISQYDRTINSIVTKSIEGITDEKIIKEKIQRIKENNDLSLEELFVIDNLKKTFSLTNGITEASFFQDMIVKCNENIKTQIIRSFNSKLTTIIKQNARATKQDLIGSYTDSVTRYAKDNLTRTDIRSGPLKNR